MSAAPPGSPSSRPSPTARRRTDTPGRSAPAGDEARARGTDIGGEGHDDGEDAKKDKEDHERLKLPYVAIGETMRLSEGEGDAMEYFYFLHEQDKKNIIKKGGPAPLFRLCFNDDTTKRETLFIKYY